MIYFHYEKAGETDERNNRKNRNCWHAGYCRWLKIEKKVLSANDIEMDRRAESAVKAAIKKARICNKPVARYDSSAKTAVLEQ